MRFTDRRNTLEPWRVPKREQDQKKPPMSLERCYQVPRLPRNMKVDVQKCHACHATWRSMSKNATPATQHQSRCQKVQRLPRWSSLIHVPVGWDGVGKVGRGGVGCGNNVHVHGNLIIFLAVQHTQALLIHDQLPVGWGALITFMFLCTHTDTATLSFFLLSNTHRHCSFMISYRWVEAT